LRVQDQVALHDIESWGSHRHDEGDCQEFHELTSDFAAKAQVRFVEPEGLGGYLKTMPDNERAAAGEEA
jgi:hypothetical protein